MIDNPKTGMVVYDVDDLHLAEFPEESRGKGILVFANNSWVLVDDRTGHSNVVRFLDGFYPSQSEAYAALAEDHEGLAKQYAESAQKHRDTADKLRGMNR